MMKDAHKSIWAESDPGHPMPTSIHQPKNLLFPDEKAELNKMGRRIDLAMKKRNIQTVSELNHIILQKRGDSPDRSLYHKIKYPPYGGIGSFYHLSLENLIVIADALDVSTDYLLGIRRKQK